MALQEAYPELRAQASYQELHRTLVETEERIALARNYYNDSATFHNTRLERVPDRYVANLLRMQPWWVNFLENITTVQFEHRMMAYALVLFAAWHAWRAGRAAPARPR